MANGLDPRVLQQQGRAFQIAASTILQKRQQEAQAEDAAKRTMLTAGVKLFENPNIPPDAAARLYRELLTQMGVGGEQVTGEDLSEREDFLDTRELFEQLARDARGKNVSDTSLAIEAAGTGDASQFKPTIDPLIAQQTATSRATELSTDAQKKLRTAQLETEVGLSRDKIRAQIAKLEREIKNVGKAGGPKVTGLLATLKAMENSLNFAAFGDELRGIKRGTTAQRNIAKFASLKFNQARNAIFNQLAESKDLPGLQEFFLFQQNPIAAEQRPPEIQAQIDRVVTGQSSFPSPESSKQPGLSTEGTQDVATVSPQSAGGARQQGAPARPITALRKAVDAKEIKPEVFARRLGSIPNLSVGQFEQEMFRLVEKDTISADKAAENIIVFQNKSQQTDVLGPPVVR